MTRLFWIGVLGLAMLEIALVYFIMPMPGSQRMRSIEFAHAMYTWRWIGRAAFGAMVLAGIAPAWRTSGRAKWLMPAALLAVAGIVYAFNFQMSADHMFLQPKMLRKEPASRNTVARERLVVGIEVKSVASGTTSGMSAFQTQFNPDRVLLVDCAREIHVRNKDLW